MRTHNAVVVAYGDLEAEIDVDLADPILEIWTAGIPTIHSCQDIGENIAAMGPPLPHLDDVVRHQRGRSIIGFPTARQLLDFYAAVANSGPRDAFYERMIHWASPGAWECTTGLRDWGLETDRGTAAADGTPLSRFAAASFHVRFDRSDIGEITERLRRHNRGEAVALGRPTWASIGAQQGGGQATPAESADTSSRPRAINAASPRPTNAT